MTVFFILIRLIRKYKIVNVVFLYTFGIVGNYGKKYKLAVWWSQLR